MLDDESRKNILSAFAFNDVKSTLTNALSKYIVGIYLPRIQTFLFICFFHHVNLEKELEKEIVYIEKKLLDEVIYSLFLGVYF